jgi:hypothetical protein
VHRNIDDLERGRFDGAVIGVHGPIKCDLTGVRRTHIPGQ